MANKYGWSFKKLKEVDASVGSKENIKIGKLFQDRHPAIPALPKVEESKDNSRESTIEKVKGFKQKIKEIKSDLLNKSEKKYVHVNQHWSSKTYNRATNQYENPIQSTKLQHMDDLHRLEQFHKRAQHVTSDSPKAPWGHESYEVHPDGKLSFVGADYDSKD